jgi:hypothetical protein
MATASLFGQLANRSGTAMRRAAHPASDTRLGRALDPCYPFFYQIRQDPELDDIRRDPRYAALLARIHLRT